MLSSLLQSTCIEEISQSRQFNGSANLFIHKGQICAIMGIHTEKRLSKDLVKEGHLKYIGLRVKCTKDQTTKMKEKLKLNFY